MDSSPSARLERALHSLESLSVGDAFGEGFFMSWELAARLMGSGEFGSPPYDFQDEFISRELIDSRRLDFHQRPWRWTDDTAMALEIVAELRENEIINPDSLALRFCYRYRDQPNRGYGGAMHSLLPRLSFENWRESAPNLFDGQGSFGNGAAMRVAPLGAYFADDLDACIENARRSALVTHAHPEGVAGAIAIAVATALAARNRESNAEAEPGAFMNEVWSRTPDSEVKTRLEEARAMDDSWTSEEAADRLGAGYAVSAQDTVPFCVWCAAHTLEHFDEAMWLTVAGLGDRDTTCAIVGGIVGAGVGTEGIPREWRAAREELPYV